MKRISLALFAIAAVVAGGYFATSAYFTDTISQTGYTFNTTSADLKFQPCPGLTLDCSGVTATLDSASIPGATVVGPGLSQATDCVVIQNMGDYLLHLTAKVHVVSETKPGMWDAFLVSAAYADSHCNGTSWAITERSAHAADTAGDIPLIDLAPGGRMYVILGNAWDSTGDQNALQNGTLVLDVSMTGKTN